jgi:hypothetical protein
MSFPRSLARRSAMVGSMLLLAVTCAAWAHSARFKDTISHWRALNLPPEQQLVPGHAHWRNLTLEIDRGDVYVQRATYAYGTSPPELGFAWSSTPVQWELFLCSPASPDFRISAAGFSFATWDRFPDWRNAALRVPLWLIASVSGAWPVLGLATMIRRRRAYGEGRCTACGYDLRATPQRCPECGLIVSEKAT